MDFTSQEAAAYLAAMIDGEGTVSVHSARSSNRTVRIANTDWELILAVEECCALLDIGCVIRKRLPPAKKNWKIGWDVTISGRANLKKVKAAVPLRSPQKIRRLDQLLASYSRPQMPTKEQLVRMYVDEKKSYAEIMKAFGVGSTNTVSYWLKKHGIPPRTRSEAGLISWDTGPRGVLRAV